MLIAAVGVARPAHAQNWSFDARQIGLGSPVGGQNLASSMIAGDQGYRAIVLPFGLIQVIGDFRKLNPANDDFDFVRAVEDVASPIHYTFGRDSTNTGQAFVVDLRNANLNRDLGMYRGFDIANQPRAEGLAAPVWGHTFRVRQDKTGAYQGFFLGAGPYISMRADLSVDNQLINVLASPLPIHLPSTQLRSATALRAQGAAAIAGGYRGRFSLPQRRSDRDGVYVAVNYNVLRGIRYEDFDIGLRLETDLSGLLTVNSQLPAPLTIIRDHAKAGWGRAVDVGVGAVVDRWEVGFGANGIGNRIDWTDVVRTTYALSDPLGGNADFVERSEPAVDAHVTLPIGYVANVGYSAERWTALTDLRWGLGGTSWHGGYEYRFTRGAGRAGGAGQPGRAGGIEVRGGAMYGREVWNPTGGIGLNLSSHTALDLAIYGNTANVDRARHLAVAVSIRLRP